MAKAFFSLPKTSHLQQKAVPVLIALRRLMADRELIREIHKEPEEFMEIIRNTREVISSIPPRLIDARKALIKMTTSVLLLGGNQGHVLQRAGDRLIGTTMGIVLAYLFVVDFLSYNIYWTGALPNTPTPIALDDLPPDIELHVGQSANVHIDIGRWEFPPIR